MKRRDRFRYMVQKNFHFSESHYLRTIVRLDLTQRNLNYVDTVKLLNQVF